MSTRNTVTPDSNLRKGWEVEWPTHLPTRTLSDGTTEGDFDRIEYTYAEVEQADNPTTAYWLRVLSVLCSRLHMAEVAKLPGYDGDVPAEWREHAAEVAS